MFNSLEKIITSFGDFSVFHWLIISGVIWIFTYGLYLKCMKLLLQRVGVAKQDQKYLVETIWHLCFTAISLPVIFSCVGGSIREIWNLSGGWVDKLDYQLSKCKIHEDIPVAGVWTVFVLHSSFSMHDFVNICYSKGFKNLEFLQKQLFLAIFILTYYSKCPTLGLSVLFLLHRASLVELVSKLCWLLAHFTRSTSLNYFSRMLCGYFLIIWSGAFLYTLPVFLSLSKTINSHMLKAELKTLILLDFLLWVYVSTSIFASMFTRVMMSVVMPGPDRPRSLEHFLFGCDPWVQKLTQQGKRSETFCVPVEEQLKNSEDSLSRPKNHSRALIQTIRCSILLKRKLRRMREEKAKQTVQKQIEDNETLTFEPTVKKRNSSTLLQVKSSEKKNRDLGLQQVEAKLYKVEMEEVMNSERLEHTQERLNRIMQLLEAQVLYIQSLDFKARALARLAQLTGNFAYKDLTLTETLAQTLDGISWDWNLLERLGEVYTAALSATDTPEQLYQLLEEFRDKRKDFQTASNTLSQYLRPTSCGSSRVSSGQLRKFEGQYDSIHAAYDYSRKMLESEIPILINERLEVLGHCFSKLVPLQEKLIERDHQFLTLSKEISKSFQEPSKKMSCRRSCSDKHPQAQSTKAHH